MQSRLYRSLVCLTALSLLSFGMRLGHPLRLHDAGSVLEPMELFLLVGVGATAVAGVAALLQVTPSSDASNSSTASRGK